MTTTYSKEQQAAVFKGVSLVQKAYNNTLFTDMKFEIDKNYGDHYHSDTSVAIPLRETMGAGIITHEADGSTTVDIVYRGTEFNTPFDVLTDLTDVYTYLNHENFKPCILRRDLKPGVHAGGHKRWADLISDGKFYKSLNMHLRGHKSPDTLRVYGHSMGCWPAILTALDIFALKDTVAILPGKVFNIECHLYAPPTFCDSAFLQLIKSILLQIRFKITFIVIALEHDIVPDLPLDFKQAHPVTRIPSEGWIMEELKHHSIDSYPEALKKYFEIELTS